MHGYMNVKWHHCSQSVSDSQLVLQMIVCSRYAYFLLMSLAIAVLCEEYHEREGGGAGGDIGIR